MKITVVNCDTREVTNRDMTPEELEFHTASMAEHQANEMLDAIKADGVAYIDEWARVAEIHRIAKTAVGMPVEPDESTFWGAVYDARDAVLAATTIEEAEAAVANAKSKLGV